MVRSQARSGPKLFGGPAPRKLVNMRRSNARLSGSEHSQRNEYVVVASDSDFRDLRRRVVQEDGLEPSRSASAWRRSANSMVDPKRTTITVKTLNANGAQLARCSSLSTVKRDRNTTMAMLA